MVEVNTENYSQQDISENTMKRQLSIVIWMECNQDELDNLESKLRQTVLAVYPKAMVNVFKKEYNLNEPRG